MLLMHLLMVLVLWCFCETPPRSIMLINLLTSMIPPPVRVLSEYIKYLCFGQNKQSEYCTNYDSVFSLFWLTILSVSWQESSSDLPWSWVFRNRSTFWENAYLDLVGEVMRIQFWWTLMTHENPHLIDPPYFSSTCNRNSNFAWLRLCVT